MNISFIFKVPKKIPNLTNISQLWVAEVLPNTQIYSSYINCVLNIKKLFLTILREKLW